LEEKARKTLMSSSDTGGRDDHNTPVSVLLPVYKMLGIVDLDPCSNANSRVVCTDRFDFHTRGEDGLKLSWRRKQPPPHTCPESGLCPTRGCDRAAGGYILRRTAFVNPPYGRGNGPRWAEKVAEEACNGMEIIVLVPSRTDTEAFQDYYLQADSVCFWRGRIKFEVDGKEQDPAPFPSAVIYFGGNVKAFREHFGPLGTVMETP
jgi:hypothetical protein